MTSEWKPNILTMGDSLATLNSLSRTPSSTPQNRMLQKESYHDYYHGDPYHINFNDFHRYSMPDPYAPSRVIMQDPDATLLPHTYFPLSTELDAQVRFADDDIDPEYAVEDAYHSIGALQYANQNSQFSQQLNDQYTDTLEPTMTLWRRESCSFVDQTPETNPDFLSSNYSFDSTPIDHCSPSYQPCVQQDYLVLSDEESSPTSTDAALGTALYKQGTNDEEVADKPYARLIYECLMQAPGHRMMLREIYDWFIANTKKPRESGTNGWQNSIRHNLSMNQAFENDKSTSSPGQNQARKANSVWVLTKHAEKNGVQSTTRYRKSGAVRKSALGRTPGVQGPRPGMRGARATRRARLRTQAQPLSSAEVCPLGQELPHLPQDGMRHVDSVPLYAHGSGCKPLPPAGGDMFESVHPPVKSEPFEPDQALKAEHTDFFLENITVANDYFHQPFGNPVFDSMTKIGTN